MTPAEIIQKYVEFRDFQKDINLRVAEGDPATAALIKRIGDESAPVEIRLLMALDLVERVRWQATGLKPYVEGMEMMEGFLLQTLNEQGADNIKTPHGTAYKTTSMSAKVADVETFMNYVFEADARQLLTSHVAKDAVQVHMDEHQGRPPPGVDVAYFTKIGVRRA